MSVLSVKIFPMEQLSVPLRELDPGRVLHFPKTFGNTEAEAMAALLVRMCIDAGAWGGFRIDDIGTRVAHAYHRFQVGDTGMFAFALDPKGTFDNGIIALREAGAIEVESMTDGHGRFDVVYPTEVLIERLRPTAKA